MDVFNRFIVGAVLGSIFTAAAGAAVASFGIGSVNGIVVAAFVGIVAGAASVAGGAI